MQTYRVFPSETTYRDRSDALRAAQRQAIANAAEDAAKYPEDEWRAYAHIPVYRIDGEKCRATCGIIHHHGDDTSNIIRYGPYGSQHITDILPVGPSAK